MKRLRQFIAQYRAYITVDGVMYLVLLAFIAILFAFFR